MFHKRVMSVRFRSLMSAFFVCVITVVFSSSCCSHRMTDTYTRNYKYLKNLRSLQKERSISSKDIPPYFLVINVNAPRLNYESFDAFIKTLQWGVLFRRDPMIGHVWVILGGKIKERTYFFEGGHSGELGLSAPKYFDEVLRRAQEGLDPNPVQYLYKALPDGYLEIGPGIHTPTSSILIPLSRQQFLSCLSLFDPRSGYDFSHWSLRDHNCITFLQALLSRADIYTHLQQSHIQIPEKIQMDRRKIRLWTDSQFSIFTLTTVDDVEKWMYIQLAKGKAFNSKKWYRSEFSTWKQSHLDIAQSEENMWCDIARLMSPESEKKRGGEEVKGASLITSFQ